MKRSRLLALCVFLMLLFSGCDLFRTPAEEPDYRQRVSEWVEVDVSGGEQTYLYDDHGGFLGDGMTFVVIRFPDAALVPALEADQGWRELPLSENLSAALYGTGEKGGLLIADDQGDPYFPDVENGYWYFFDRRDDDLAPGGHYDDSWLFARYSYNFCAAVYDADTNTMYITAFDT